MPPKNNPPKGPSAQQDTKEVRTRPLDCAIVVDWASPANVIGGRNIGWPQNHDTKFCNGLPVDITNGWVGVSIWIHRRIKDDSATYFDIADSPAPDTHRLILKFFHGDFKYRLQPVTAEQRARLPPIVNKTGDDVAADKLTAIVITMAKGKNASLTGFAMPTSTATSADADAMFSNGNFEGVKPLLDLALQTEFTIIVGSTDVKNTRKWFFDGKQVPNIFSVYEPVTGYDLTRYNLEMPRPTRDTEYIVKAYKFDRTEDYYIAHQQGVIQDVWRLSQHVTMLRRRRVDSVWIRRGNVEDPTQSCEEWLVLVKFGFTDNEKLRLQDSIDRCVGGGSARFDVAFGLPPTPGSEDQDRDTKVWPARLVDQAEANGLACDLALNVRRPKAYDPGWGCRNGTVVDYMSLAAFREVPNDKRVLQPIYLKFDAGVNVAERRVDAMYHAFSDAAYPPVTDNDKAKLAARLQHLVKRDLLTGSGFMRSLSSQLTSSTPNPTGDEPAGQLAGLNLRVANTLPLFDIRSGMSMTTVKLCLAELGEEGIHSLGRYFEAARIGVYAIIGFAGSGKTQVLAGVASLLTFNTKDARVYAAAPTHVATTNFAHRAFAKTQAVVNTLPADYLQKGMRIIVRGYAIKSEVRAFMKFGWQECVSLDHNVAIDEEQDAYRPTAWEFKLSAAYWLWVTLKYKPGTNGMPLPPRLVTLRKTIENDPKYSQVIEWVTKTGSAARLETFDAAELEASARLVSALLQEVILQAHMVCTTPFASGDKEYAAFNEIATSVVLDEAGAMTQPDALLVWGNGLRPCVMAGDEKQLRPTVMSHGKKDPETGKVLNAFGAVARISVLEQLKRSGFPCYLLTKQHRIVNGGFDVAMETIYKEIKDRLSYSPGAALETVPHAAPVDRWLQARFKLKASPPGKALGAFLSHPGRCETDPTTNSRFNMGQIQLTVATIALMLKENPSLKGSDFVVIVPYRAGLQKLRSALDDSTLPAGCRDVALNTADSFQGREASIVFFLLTVNKTTGPLFVGDPHRVCVGLTRHEAALVVVGDIDTLTPATINAGSMTGRECQGDGGQDGRVNGAKRAAFVGMLGFFGQAGRVQKVDDKMLGEMRAAAASR